MAALMVRQLRTGRAVVNYVGRHGMVSDLLTVPAMSAVRLSREAFCQLRVEVLSQCSSAIPATQAAELVAVRERAFLTCSAAVAEPETFRVKAPPLAPGQDRSRPDAAGRGRSRRSSKLKSVE
jgi:hypothetical protein